MFDWWTGSIGQWIWLTYMGGIVLFAVGAKFAEWWTRPTFREVSIGYDIVYQPLRSPPYYAGHYVGATFPGMIFTTIGPDGKAICFSESDFEWELTDDFTKYPHGYRFRCPGDTEWRG